MTARSLALVFRSRRPLLSSFATQRRGGRARTRGRAAEPINDSEGYTPPPEYRPPSPLSINGYVDVGFANAQGDGTSFAPGDTRLPLDYGVDAFAPAVNSRGDAASPTRAGAHRQRFLAALGGDRRASVVPAEHAWTSTSSTRCRARR